MTFNAGDAGFMALVSGFGEAMALFIIEQAGFQLLFSMHLSFYPPSWARQCYFLSFVITGTRALQYIAVVSSLIS